MDATFAPTNAPTSSMPAFHDPAKPLKRFAGVLVADSPRKSILLGLKNRGFGTGLWQHSFAGKIEKGETAEEAAVRELGEEAGIEVNASTDLDLVGVFYYEFLEPSPVPFLMEVTIYKIEVDKSEVAVTPSDEMTPEWFDLDLLPLKDMWPDNAHWLPSLFQRREEEGHALPPTPWTAYFLYRDLRSVHSYSIKGRGQV